MRLTSEVVTLAKVTSFEFAHLTIVILEALCDDSFAIFDKEECISHLALLDNSFTIAIYSADECICNLASFLGTEGSQERNGR